jgi:hypothetical protein
MGRGPGGPESVQDFRLRGIPGAGRPGRDSRLASPASRDEAQRSLPPAPAPGRARRRPRLEQRPEAP